MADMTEKGQTGLDQWSGIIREDFLKELRGKEGYKKYNEMRLNSAPVGAMLMAVEQSIRGIQWQYVSDEGEEDERIIFLDEALNNMSHTWNDHLVEALSMMPFGYAPFEIVYKRSDGGGITWRKFAIRGQDTVLRWLIDENGGLGGLVQQGAPYYRTVEIPIEKMVLYRTRSEKNNPEGRSILRTAWVSYFYCKNIQQFEGIGIERDLAGLPVISLPEGASTDTDDPDSDASKAAKTARNIRNDEQSGLVLPFGWEFELASTGGSRMFDTDKIIKRYESRMLMSALAQFLILGQDKVGTQALSGDQTDFWTMAVNATADIIAETHTEFAMKRLLRLNGMDDIGIRLEHSPAGDTDINMLADFFQKVGDKITWMSSDEAWLRGLARLPEVDPEEIEAEKEKRRDEQQAIMQQQGGGGAFGRPAQPKPNDMGAEMYAADLPPDEEERRKAERKYNRTVRRAFAEQEKRILKEVTK